MDKSITKGSDSAKRLPRSGLPKKGTRARGPEAREVRRNQIVDTASLIFAQLGYAATEMDRVALDLGFSKGTLYLYFENKEALFLACVDQGMRELNRTVREAMDRSGDPLEKLLFAFRAYLEFFDEHPHRVELLIQERANFKDRETQTYFQHRANNRSFWKEIYQTLINTGRIMVDKPLDDFLDQIGNLLYGTMFTQRYNTRSLSIADKTINLVDFVFQGFLTPREQKTWKEKLKKIG